MSIAAGQQLRRIRERLGLTLRDVEAASSAIAERHGNSEFSISLARLSEIETKGITPSIFRVYSLLAIYRVDHFAEVERQAIERALAQAKGNKLLAARLLRIGKTTLYRKLSQCSGTANDPEALGVVSPE